MAFFISGLSANLKKIYASLRLQFRKKIFMVYTIIKEQIPHKEHLTEILNCCLPFNPVKNFPGYIALALALAAGLAWAGQTVPVSGYAAYNSNVLAAAWDYRDLPDTGDSAISSDEKTIQNYRGSIPADESQTARTGLYRPQRSVQPQVSRGWNNRSDIYLMARVIEGEAADEPFIGKVAVGAVIMNRVESGQFPHDVRQVVYQPLAFEAVQNGQYMRPLTADSVKAAQLAVRGWDPTDGAIYYWNPVTAKSKWVWQKPVTMQIGKHVFAK